MFRSIFLIMLTAVMAVPVSAQYYIPDSRLSFTPVPNGVRVAGNTGHGARGTWCAAADYARENLGAKGYQDLHVSEPQVRGMGRNNTVTFTLDPTGLDTSRVTIVGTSLSKRGATLSIDHALTFCADLRLPSR